MNTLTNSVVNSMCRFGGVGAGSFPLFDGRSFCASSSVVAVTITS